MRRLGLGVPASRPRPRATASPSSSCPRHALGDARQDRPEHLQPAGHRGRRGHEFVEGKVGSSAMPHKLNPVASGSVVLLGRLVRARAALALEYIHSEWEDDHRQGETAWAFPQEVCLLVGAQLAICAAPARQPGGQAGEHAPQPRPQRRRRAVGSRDDGAGAEDRPRQAPTSWCSRISRERSGAACRSGEAVAPAPRGAPARVGAADRAGARLPPARSASAAYFVDRVLGATGVAAGRAPRGAARLAARRTASAQLDVPLQVSRRARERVAGSPTRAGPPRRGHHHGSRPRCCGTSGVLGTFCRC